MNIKASKQRKDTEILVRVSTEQRKQIKEWADKHNLSQAEAIRIILEDAITQEDTEVERKRMAG